MLTADDVNVCRPSAFVRIRQVRGLRVVTAVAMVSFVVVVYVVVVVGGGALLGHTRTPSLPLSVLATAIVAIAFEFVQRNVNRGLSRAMHQDRLSPYQVLAHLPKTVTGAYPADGLPVQMAMVLGEGTGAAGAEVWLMVHGRLQLAARWPTTPASTLQSAAIGTTMVAAGGPATTVAPDWSAMFAEPRMSVAVAGAGGPV